MTVKPQGTCHMLLHILRKAFHTTCRS